MIPRSNHFVKLLALLLVVILIGCATTSILITVKRPAEVNLKDYNKLAIGDIEGKNSKDIADALTTALFNSGHFEVLDRNHLQSIMKEHQINMSGIVDESTATELGKIIGAAVLVFGRVQTSDFKQELTKGDPYTDKAGKYHQWFTRKGVYTLKVNLQLVDMKTGKILAIKNLNSAYSDKTSADRKDPPSIDQTALLTLCINNVISSFTRVIAPYDVQVKASFLKDKMLPEVESAILQMKIGEWDEAISILEESSKKSNLEPKCKAKAHYNLGLAQMYLGKHDEALANFKMSMKLQPQNKVYLNRINECKKEKEKAEKLKQQI